MRLFYLKNVQYFFRIIFNQKQFGNPRPDIVLNSAYFITCVKKALKLRIHYLKSNVSSAR